MYSIISETALEQLDHLFLVIGNGYDYDPVRGPIARDGNKGILEDQEHDFEYALAKHQKYFDETVKEYDKYLDDYGDLEVPLSIIEMIQKAKDRAAIPEYKLMDREYYFNPELVAAQSIAHTIEENKTRRGTGNYWRTPYPICEYSAITQVRKTDDPVLIELALCTAKSWLIVLDYYMQNGLYLTQEQVDEKPIGAAYYQSIMYMTKSHADLSAIINELEKEDD
jgi:hypothetical protein